MRRAPPGIVTVKCLDVSHYDETIDFSKVKAAGFEACYAKCTEGTAVIDARYSSNKQKAKAAGMLFGAYHFFRPGSDAKTQAEHFLMHADLKPGELIPSLDWEVSQGRSDVPKAQLWLNIVEQACGQKPVIYGPPYMLNDFNLPASFRDYTLWVAHYGVTAPLLPAPWKYWSFWQYSEKGSVPGIPAADEDMDMWNGSLDQLKKMVL